MIRLRNVFPVFIVSSLILAGCGDDGDELPDVVSSTVLIYMAADNSMDSEVDYTLEQLKTGAKHSGGTVVVYLDRENETPRLFKLTPAGEEVLLKTYDEENSASAVTLARVIGETKELEPADQFGLVLWSHALGWMPAGYSNTTRSTTLKAERSFPRTRYICTDDTPADGTLYTGMMEITDLADKIPDGTAEFILFDVCLMGSVEALYELRHTCDYMIASPTEVLAEADWDASGMPYDEVLPLLFGGKDDLIKVCQKYDDHYHGMGSEILRSATVALVDARGLDGLYNTAASILEGKLTQAASLDVSSLQVYHTPNVPQVFFDLGDVMEQLSTEAGYGQFKEQLARTVIYKAATEQFVDVPIDPDHFSGLSMYVPLEKWKGNREYEYYFSLGWSSVY